MTIFSAELMKNSMTNTLSKLWRSPLLAFALILFTQCKSSIDLKEELPPFIGTTNLKFNIQGLEEAATQIKSNIGSKASIARSSAVQTTETFVSGTYADALISLEQDRKPVSSSLASSNNEVKATSRQTKAATSPLPTNAKYRILLLDAQDNILQNVVGSSGTDPNIPVNLGWTYKWLAFSTNETGSVPDVNSATKRFAKADLTNKDILLASGTISIGAGENYLSIVLKRQTARIRARVNVRGMFGTIATDTKLSIQNNASTGINPITMGDLDIISGNFINVGPVNGIVNAASMVNETVAEGASVKLASFYTLNTTPIAAKNLKFNFAPLAIVLDDARVRTFNNLTFGAEEAFTPSIGSSHFATLRLIESPIKINGIMWARTNLVYDANKLDQYRLKSNPGGSSSSTKDRDFWNWMAQTPTSATANFDACNELYPKGTWKMPDLLTWESINQPNRKEEVLGLFWGANYGAIWDRDSDYPENTAYDNNVLYISYGGFRTEPNFFGNTSVQESPIGIAAGLLAGGECHYWTSTSQNNSRGRAVKASFTHVGWIFGWSNITYTSEKKSEGRNVRCVRAKNNPNS